MMGNLVLVGSGNHTVSTLANHESSTLIWVNEIGKRDWWRRAAFMLPGLRSQTGSGGDNDNLSI